VSRAVAVDLGQRRIGVAVSDAAGTMAFPRPVVERQGDWVRAIADVVAEIDAVEASSVCELAAALLAPGRLSAACIGPNEDHFLAALERITPDLAHAA